MSKVLVDRELLERISAERLRFEDTERVLNAAAELRPILAAQPAEAEGVELVPFWVLFDATTPEPLIKKHMPEGVLAFFDNEEDARRAKALHPGTDYKRAPYVRAAALSAVTAERDRLLAELERAHRATNSECMDWAREYERRKEVQAERDQLRAEVEALQASRLYWVAPRGLGIAHCVTDERYRNFSPAIQAHYEPVRCIDAMAAKEA